MATLPDVELLQTPQGLRYLLLQGPDTHGVSQSLRSRGVYEPNLQVLATALLNANPAEGLVLDIGANLGSFTVPMAKAFGHLRFHCWEVQPPVYYQLCANLLLNGLGHVTAHPYGLGASACEVDVALPNYADEINIGSFSLDPAMRQGVRGGEFRGESVRVKVVNLDSLFLERVRLVKIDVEGLELDVLRGAAGTLVRSGFPPILYEAWAFDWYAERKAALEQFLQSLGYVLMNFDGSENFVAQHPAFGPMLQAR
ncbi:FkbM family methyltransferase [Roseateles sp. BYS87W]|uniref:FkbM family methyltransferase n=1 Tax=Pelomonas baiyunensis TaxID=3299026 RepID=A0ABW7GW67_9BURK